MKKFKPRESIARFFQQRLTSLVKADESSAPFLRRNLLRVEKLVYLTVRKTGRDLCLERAASLSFTSTVSFIPLVVLVFLMFNSRGSFEEVLEKGREVLLRHVAEFVATPVAFGKNEVVRMIGAAVSNSQRMTSFWM